MDLPQDVLDHGERVFGLLDQGLDEQAEPELRALLRQVERHLGPDDPDTVELYDVLGGVLYRLHRLPESEAMHREALTRYRRSLGPEDPITLEDLSSEFGVSRERVRQIEVRAFEKVQDAVKKNLARREAPRAQVEAAAAL